MKDETEKLAAAEKHGYEAGKAYWEPSEYHKEIWRKEARIEERKEIYDDLIKIADKTENEGLRSGVEGYFKDQLSV